jgi:hypothetical protein
VLADADAGDGRVDRPELAADLGGGGRLEVPHVLCRGPAEEVEEDHVLGLARAGARGPAGLGGEEVREGEPAAEEGEGAGGQGLPPGEPVAAPAGRAEEGDHAAAPAGGRGRAGVTGGM